MQLIIAVSMFLIKQINIRKDRIKSRRHMRRVMVRRKTHSVIPSHCEISTEQYLRSQQMNLFDKG